MISMDWKRRKSFSLVEVLISLSVIVIFSSLMIPHFLNVKRYLLINEVDKLFVTFSYLQQRAIASNQVQKMFFDFSDRSYYYFDKTGKKSVYNLADSIKFGFMKNSKGPPGQTKKARNLIRNAVTFDLRNKPPRASFYPDGKITPGTVYLVDKEEKMMVALTCPLGQVSYIRKYKYDNGSWMLIEHK